MKYIIKNTERDGDRMERTQVLLEPTQRKELDQIAREEGISRSNLLRILIKESLRERKRKRMAMAVNELAGDYKNNPELTSFNVLDSEDFNA